MSYTGSEMVVAAEAHYRNAHYILNRGTVNGIDAAEAAAEAQAGLLAMKLAEYAFNPPTDDIDGGDWVPGDWVPGDPVR